MAAVMDKKTQKLADALHNSVLYKNGVLEGKRRVRSFRGQRLLDFILSPAGKKVKGLEEIENEVQALEFCHKLLASKPTLFAPCERMVNKATGLREKQGGLYVLRPTEQRAGGAVRTFDRSARYYWVYQGNESWNNIKLALAVAGVIAVTCYQVWPISLRIVVWYIAVTLLLLLLGVSAIQLIVFGVSWLLGYELWILPNLWSEEASIFELFKPLYTFETGAPGRGWYRLTVGALVVALCAWAVTAQQTDMDTFLTVQRQFVEDLYAGTLLGDGSEGSMGLSRATGPQSTGGLFGARYGAEAYGGRPVKVPRFEELEKELGSDEEEKEGGGGGSGDEEPALAAAAAKDAAAASAVDADMDAMIEAEAAAAAAAAEAADAAAAA